ncbi:MAG: SDR family NAD(P)-dependent oxidoreductase [Desulfobacterales bacterium]|jgi:NAD(P)-dependent dehydrogenase (short-subunit alcohol dehydrogenase family)
MDLKKLFSLNGKTALVTGAAQGLGREICLWLAQHAASLIFADKTYPQRTVQEIEKCGGHCITTKTDISDEQLFSNP